MIDTVMALWNREYNGKGVKLFSAMLIFCISISLLLVTECVTGSAPGATDSYNLKDGLSATEQATPGQASGGALNPAALTPTLAPLPYATAPAEPQIPTPAGAGASNSNPASPQPSPGTGGSPTVIVTAGATPSAMPAATPTPTPPPVPTPTPTSPPPPTPTSPPPPTPTPVVMPSPTSMGGMTATPVATQTAAAITPAPTGDPAASITPAPTGDPAAATTATPAVTPMAGATVTLASMATGKDMLLASITGRLFSSLVEGNLEISIGVVTLITMLCQLGIYLLKRSRSRQI